MEKTISFVFKTLIITIILGTAVTLLTTIVDAFITTMRIQNIAEYIQTDIARNNCLLNDTYTAFLSEINSAQTRSETVKICCYGSDVIEEGHEDLIADGSHGTLGSKAPVELFLKDSNPANKGTATYFIQTDSEDTGETLGKDDNGSVSPNDGQFYVANYGDILTLRINCIVRTKFWGLGGNKSVASARDYYFSAGFSLDYNIPALAYIK